VKKAKFKIPATMFLIFSCSMDPLFLLWVAAGSMAATAFFLPVFMQGFKEYGFLDKPGMHGHEREAVPYGTGVVFVAIFVVMMLMHLNMTSELMVLMFGGVVMTGVSFWDDHWKLGVRLRLLIQVLVALAIVLAGVSVPALSNPFGPPIVLDIWQTTLSVGSFELTIAWLASGVAVVWLLVMMNAINWLDGAPGMVSGMSTVTCLVILVLTLQGFHEIDQTSLGIMAASVGGATMVFWFFDFFGPRTLMGDSGTMFLGLILGVMAIYSGAKLATAIIVLAFPLFDLFWTIGRRILQGRSPFEGDLSHFHHELMDAGLSGKQVNLFFYATALFFGGATLFLESTGKLITLLLLFILMVAIRFGIRRTSDSNTA
jgi:UDP-GlcNAc:undecaprenyl-phosphate/decaprenyl-phosphate GlcNAc-1-phosphate transferase